MKILMVNKFLYPNGGAEVYMIKLGQYLEGMGHEVQYFGMEDQRNVVGNQWNSYTRNIDFRNNDLSLLSKIIYAKNSIYSKEARNKIRVVLERFKPDLVHLNNINYQLTPSIILEIEAHHIPIIQTVHDSQIACPNHRLYIEKTGQICEKCVGGNYLNCIKERCVQDSLSKSTLAAFESVYYHNKDIYNKVDRYVCPSKFIGKKIIQGGVKKEKIEILYNFSDNIEELPAKKQEEGYALYFGRLSVEKGIRTLIKVCKELPEVKFVIAGIGPLEDDFNNIDNVSSVGFKSGEELLSLIRNAEFSLYPSECYENCPLSIIESQNLGTPIIGSDLGGIKELIEHEKTGLIFKAADANALKSSIQRLWNDKKLVKYMEDNCLEKKDNSIEKYFEKLIKIYQSLLQ